MKTPIRDFVDNYIKSDTVHFHMPGHKGVPFLGCEPRDITEIEGADVLYSPNGVIAQSEEYATGLFGTAHTFYSTEGSSLAIRAMLALVRAESGETSPLILAAKNAHKAFIYGCALLDLRVEWLCGEETSHVCGCAVTPQALQKKLCDLDKKPSAVYITSPDYLGGISDIAGLAAVCKEHKIPLLVDNAHGAYLRFLEKDQHPISLGASLCCDSAHKTLPVLTGGAYLHVSKNAPATYVENARKYLSLFSSTSPSYLILQSLDLCNAYINDSYRERLAACAQKISDLKKRLTAHGFSFIDGEPLKIVFDTKKIGYTGTELADVLREHKIECEFADPDVLVLMLTPENKGSDIKRLEDALESIEKRPSVDAVRPFSLGLSEIKASIREAVLGDSEIVDIDLSVGRICSSPTVSCPPAVPIVISGELITSEHVRAMKYYGHRRIEVLKQK